MEELPEGPAAVTDQAEEVPSNLPYAGSPLAQLRRVILKFL